MKNEQPLDSQLRKEGSGGEQKEQLSPTLQGGVLGMPLNFSETEYEKACRDHRATSRETSADAFLQIAKKLIKGEDSGPNSFGAMARILDRESMADHPKKEILLAALKELKDTYENE